MEVARLGVKLELQLPTYATATSNTGSELRLRPTPQLTGTPEPYNPLSEARDQTGILLDTSRVHFH